MLCYVLDLTTQAGEFENLISDLGEHFGIREEVCRFNRCVFLCAAILNELLQRENRVLHFWTLKKRRLDQCQQYLVFERSAKQVSVCVCVCPPQLSFLRHICCNTVYNV